MPTPTEIPNRLQFEVSFVFQEVVKWEVLHGYQILSNPKYSNEFYYVGAFVGEREKLIEDGFGENE